MNFIFILKYCCYWLGQATWTHGHRPRNFINRRKSVLLTGQSCHRNQVVNITVYYNRHFYHKINTFKYRENLAELIFYSFWIYFFTPVLPILSKTCHRMRTIARTTRNENNNEQFTLQNANDWPSGLDLNLIQLEVWKTHSNRMRA